MPAATAGGYRTTAESADGQRLGAWSVTIGSLLAVPVGIAASLNSRLADPGHPAGFAISGAILTLAHVLVFAGVAVLLFGGAAGRGRLRAVASAVALVALAGQVIAEATLRFDFTAGSTFFSFDTPLLALGLILLGLAIIRAGVWTGWRRYTPLAWGLYIPLVLVPAFIVTKGPSYPALTGMAVLVVAFGVAMIQEARPAR